MSGARCDLWCGGLWRTAGACLSPHVLSGTPRPSLVWLSGVFVGAGGMSRLPLAQVWVLGVLSLGPPLPCWLSSGRSRSHSFHRVVAWAGPPGGWCPSVGPALMSRGAGLVSLAPPPWGVGWTWGGLQLCLGVVGALVSAVWLGVGGGAIRFWLGVVGWVPGVARHVSWSVVCGLVACG